MRRHECPLRRGRRDPYRCCFTSFDHTLCQDAYLLPLFDKTTDFAAYNAEADTVSVRKVILYGVYLREFGFKITWDGHFFYSIDALARGFFLI